MKIECFNIDKYYYHFINGEIYAVTSPGYTVTIYSSNKWKVGKVIAKLNLIRKEVVDNE